MTKEQKYDMDHGIIKAIWAVDSNTGEECLINLYTNEIIAKRQDGKILDPGITVWRVLKF